MTSGVSDQTLMPPLLSVDRTSQALASKENNSKFLVRITRFLLLHHDLKPNSKQPSSIYGQQNWLKMHSILLQHQIGTEYFYCTTHWTTGYRRYPLHFAKAQTQQVIGDICHRPYLLLLLQMVGIRRKDRSVAVSAVFPVWGGVIDALEIQVFWGVEERE